MINLLNKTQNQIITIAIFALMFIISSCTLQKVKNADIIFKGGTIYTVDKNNPNVEAVAILDDKIIFVGSAEDALKLKGSKTEIVDLKNNVMIPGFIDAHGHFMGMGYTKMILDLTKAGSFEDIIIMVDEAVKNAKPGDWIIGRGWHQDKWSGNKEDFLDGFPKHEKLSEISKENPVFLNHWLL